MFHPRLLQRPAFDVVGKSTWISGQDNDIFGDFWQQCREDGLLAVLSDLSQSKPGIQTNGMFLGVSCVDNDPAVRNFKYLIAVECPSGVPAGELEVHHIPASQWAVFECRGKMPDALVQAEMYTFMQWLPSSRYTHALAPEMEVYPPTSGVENEVICEFWLPVTAK